MPGPYYFAWAAAGDPFSEAMIREDELIFLVEITHAEGNFPSLVIDIKNPRVGLLSAGRNVWCWLSWRTSAGTVQPLFNGRLIGVPQNIHEEVVRLEFVALPEDYQAQKQALAETMKVAPYWDPIWLAEKSDDPDTVLEGYTRLWHIDRVTLDVTASDILQGEDGTLVFDEDEHLYSNMTASYGQTPLRRVTMTATVTWDQSAQGTLDLTPWLYQKFGGDYEIRTFTGDGLESTWPTPDTSIGGGWTVGESSLTLKYWTPTLNYIIVFSHFIYSDSPTSMQDTNGRYIEGIVNKMVFIPFQLNRYSAVFKVNYSASRKRSETVFFSMEADIQSLITEPGATEEEVIKLNSSSIGLTVDPDGSLPIEDLRRPSFFQTDRGHQSFQYLLALARARLAMRSRAVIISFQTTWEVAIGLSCRYSATVLDRRLPGGSATGKVTNYVLTADPQNGEFAKITIESCIGHAGSVSAVAGAPIWADDGYVDAGYQMETGGTLDFDGLGELTYQSFGDFGIDDDGVNFFTISPTNAREFATFGLTGTLVEQMAAVTIPLGGTPTTPGAGFFGGDPLGALAKVPTVITLDMVPLTGGPFNTTFNVALSQLKLPKSVDLEHA